MRSSGRIWTVRQVIALHYAMFIIPKLQLEFCRQGKNKQGYYLTEVYFKKGVLDKLRCPHCGRKVKLYKERYKRHFIDLKNKFQTRKRKSDAWSSDDRELRALNRRSSLPDPQRSSYGSPALGQSYAKALRVVHLPTDKIKA